MFATKSDMPRWAIMMWISQDERASGFNPHKVAVPAPMPQDGIGAALRTAYLPRGHDMPEAFDVLLNRLR